MHTSTSSRPTVVAAPSAAARVAIAGATGYAGQELVRLLARHPAVVAYGLTEVNRDEVRGAALVANPGCYPTATQLALLPLVRAGLLAPAADIIVDAKSGVSGAGRTPSDRTHFCECHDSISAYG